MNKLFYGDNLDILRRYIKDETVDLIYLDPPLTQRPTMCCFATEWHIERESKPLRIPGAG